ncbi:hypothetical protein HK096_001993, partial [Nowakowskiella sp. JEL0078]
MPPKQPSNSASTSSKFNFNPRSAGGATHYTREDFERLIAQAEEAQAMIEKSCEIIMINTTVPNLENDDAHDLLDIIQEVLPTTIEGWIEVVHQYNTIRAEIYHKTTDFAKKVYYQLKNVPKPTGNPSIPEN